MILTHTNHFYMKTLIFAVFLFTTAFFPNAAAADQPPATENRLASNTSTAPTSGLGLFQSIISKADGDRCPMYPSCSHYATQAVERHGRLVGWILAADRLLRCGRDETRLAPKVMVNGHGYSYDPLKANTFWWERSKQ